jgi:hypothetical protein
LPDFDPSGNGHRIAAEKAPLPRSGQGVLMVTLVSALTGFNLMIGGGVGALLAVPIGLRGSAVGVPLVVGAAFGGAIGVWLGVKVAARFGGTSGGRKAFVWAVAGGLAGLCAAVALASFRINTFLPVLAVLLPGIGAWLGDRLGSRKGGPPPAADSSGSRPARNRQL